MPKFGSRLKREMFFEANKNEDGILVCRYCGCEVFRGPKWTNTPSEATIDHVIGQMYHGSIVNKHDISNWRVACRQCNNHDKNILQSRIANLFCLDRPQYADNRRELEFKATKTLGEAFVEIIQIGFYYYDCGRKRLRLNYEY